MNDKTRSAAQVAAAAEDRAIRTDTLDYARLEAFAINRDALRVARAAVGRRSWRFSAGAGLQ